MISHRMITLPKFTVSGVKTRISGRHNEEMKAYCENLFPTMKRWKV